MDRCRAKVCHGHDVDMMHAQLVNDDAVKLNEIIK